jgi:hypothetical protein
MKRQRWSAGGLFLSDWWCSSALLSDSPPLFAQNLVEAINGVIQAAKRKARGYTHFTTMHTVPFVIACKLNL